MFGISRIILALGIGSVSRRTFDNIQYDSTIVFLMVANDDFTGRRSLVTFVRGPWDRGVHTIIVRLYCCYDSHDMNRFVNLILVRQRCL